MHVRNIEKLHGNAFTSLWFKCYRRKQPQIFFNKGPATEKEAMTENDKDLPTTAFLTKYPLRVWSGAC